MPIASKPLTCLVVDDSALYRKVVRQVLDGIPDVRVVGVANDGQRAVEMIEQLRPDLVTLDLEMPRLDGIGVLRELEARGLSTAAIMVSAFTARGAKTTTTALALGAFDFILKPATNSLEESVAQLRRDLTPKLRACQTRIRSARAQGPATPAPTPVPAPAAPRPRPKQPLPSRPSVSPPSPVGGPCPVRPSLVAIGVSTGGPQALVRLLPTLPANFPTPIVLTQHMPPMFTKSLADDLDRRCKVSVSEAVDGQPLKAGSVLIAPGGRQMRIVATPDGEAVQITDDPPERNCRPAVDYLFRSVAECFGPRALGVVLTGMGDDGTLGAKAMKERGARIIAQDEATCVVYGMPKSIVDNHLADEVVPLGRIADRLQRLALGRAAG